jgi:PucR C-terminal helix-turn-helix domain/GGDEF-like domain
VIHGARDRLAPGSLWSIHNERALLVLERMEAGAAPLARRMALACREEVPEYGAVRDPAFVDEVVSHAEQHVHGFVHSARAGRPPQGEELDFVLDRGARRARELLPLDAILHAYLIGQRTVWESVVMEAGDDAEGMRAALDLTAATFWYTHAINAAVVAAYLRERGHAVAEAERGRRDLLEELLARPGGTQAARRAEALGLDPAGRFALVAAVLSGETDGGDQLRAVTDALLASLGLGPGAFVVPRHEEVVAVVPLAARRGPHEVRSMLERAAEALERTRGLSVRCGVSARCEGLGELARGYEEAHRALRHAGEADRAVALEDVGLFDELVRGADDTARALVPDLARKLWGGARDRELAATVLAYADCDLNVARAAASLHVHPNTVHYRLGRIRDLTGRDPRRFPELVELVAAVRLMQAGEG